MSELTVIARKQRLHKGLTKGQAVMISLGGAIGTSLFFSSGIALCFARPAVLISYAIAGFIAVVMVFSLSEMAVMYPAAGSVRMPFFPVMQIAGLVLLAALLITMGMDKDWNLSWIVGLPWLILLTIAYFIWKRSALSRPTPDGVSQQIGA